jgi:hypothetical protein
MSDMFPELVLIWHGVNKVARRTVSADKFLKKGVTILVLLFFTT